jgi:hypothetical protein
MGEGTKVVNYSEEIAILRAVVVALQRQVSTLQSSVENLQKRLEDSGTLYGGTVAYSEKFVKGSGWPPDSFPKSIDGFQVNYKLGE